MQLRILRVICSLIWYGLIPGNRTRNYLIWIKKLNGVSSDDILHLGESLSPVECIADVAFQYSLRGFASGILGQPFRHFRPTPLEEEIISFLNTLEARGLIIPREKFQNPTDPKKPSQRTYYLTSKGFDFLRWTGFRNWFIGLSSPVLTGILTHVLLSLL